jgi:hypothetical protein
MGDETQENLNQSFDAIRCTKQNGNQRCQRLMKKRVVFQLSSLLAVVFITDIII